jgi:ankyrin repeat protein
MSPNTREGKMKLLNVVKRGNMTTLRNMASNYELQRVGKSTLNDALFAAAKHLNDRSDMIKMLIREGANPNARDSRGNTPLTFAVQAYQIDNVRTLIKHGARPNVRGSQEVYRGYMPLHHAAMGIHEDKALSIVKLLVNHGALINSKTSDHQTPIQIAVKSYNEHIVRFLLDKGALQRGSTSPKSSSRSSTRTYR